MIKYDIIYSEGVMICMKSIRCTGCGANLIVNEDKDIITCEYCGTQYKQERAVPNTIINNTTINYINSDNTKGKEFTPSQYNTLSNQKSDSYSDSIPLGAKQKNKYIALLLCIFLGVYGAHKFYEEKYGLGILYLFTAGLFLIGWIIDIVDLLRRPDTYYV